MLLGPVLDPLRSSNILKNLNSLHIRMKQHSYNAQYLAEKLSELGIKVNYPGLKNHKGHQIMSEIMNFEYGFGGMLSIDVGDLETSNLLMEMMEKEGVGYLAVSLGYFKTLFCNSGKSTSSEVPAEKQKEIGMSEGLIRFSVGLDNNIERTFLNIKKCLGQLNLI